MLSLLVIKVTYAGTVLFIIAIKTVVLTIADMVVQDTVHLLALKFSLLKVTYIFQIGIAFETQGNT
jgi:hypothetical protein